MDAGLTASVAATLSSQILAAAKSSATEQELLIKVEAALGPVLDTLGIPKHPQYEKTLLQGRADSVYGSVTIEYESPGKLATGPGRVESFGQCRQYMREQAEIASPGSPEEALPTLAAVALDGFQIGFVLWRGGDTEEISLPDTSMRRHQMTLETEKGIFGRFQEIGPVDVTPDSVTDLLLYLRALSRRPLEAESLAAAFGPEGDDAKAVVAALHATLKGSTASRTNTLYGEWLRLFGAIYGEPSNVKRKATTALAGAYGLDDSDVGRMLFAVHTYFALIMKLLALELVALQSGAVIEPFAAGLSALSNDELHGRFAELESGQLFRAQGIENFLEGDFLGWYAEEWTPELTTAVRSLVRKLQEFEPATTTLRPDLTQDLLKSLYHRLLPKDLRHDLGEYYTPDWLAEHVLDVSGYDASPGTRILDPACGSGTFLVSAIRRMKDQAEESGLEPEGAAAAVTGGIVGFDLNPLAVIAARTNYLLAAGDLVRHLAPFRIPVYICDSVTAPTQRDSRIDGLTLRTSVADFSIPERLADPELLPTLASALEFCVSNDYSSDEFDGHLAADIGSLSKDESKSLSRLYTQILRLHKEGRDGIWPRLLSNAFAPLFARGSFDHVIGNPPWIGWESLSGDYREATKPLWADYGLFTLSGKDARLGGGKKDLSMLMTVVALEEYLRDEGILTFLITQTVLQTKGGGEGFRRFETGRRPMRVRLAEDLASFNPFEDASNWTAIISLERDQPTTYPVEYSVWKRLHGVRIRRTDSLGMVRASTTQARLRAQPVVQGEPRSPWLIGTDAALRDARNVIGRADYKAKAGVTVWLDGVYQVEVVGARPDGLVHVRNHFDVGKTALAQVDDAIEPDLLFPFVPWKRVGRWSASADRCLLVPQDPATRMPFPEAVMKARWPRTYAFLKRFEVELRARSGYRRYFEPDDPFYAIYNVSQATMSDWKMVWQTMGSEVTATVIGPRSFGPISERPTVFKNTVVFVPTGGEDEAFYLAGLMSSSWANYVLRASNVRGGKSAFATNALDRVRVPTFMPNDDSHSSIAGLAKDAAVQKAAGDLSELELTEARIDQHAAEFWRLSSRAQEGMLEVIEALR